MRGRSLLALGLCVALLAACASAPPAPTGRGTGTPLEAVPAGGATAAAQAVPSAPVTEPASTGEAATGTPDAASSDPRQVFLARAEAMLGQPYRYGGKQPGGFDCSGLVSYAASGAGISLPRTTRQLMHVGKRVRRSQIEPGDLVFMRLQHRVLHVGIALGNDLFIHAPSYGERVRVDSLAAPPYARHFLGARRVLGGEARMSGSN